MLRLRRSLESRQAQCQRPDQDRQRRAPPAQRARLLRATEAFDAVLARQSRAMQAAKTITEGLVRAIAEEVAVQRGRGAVYGPAATTAPKDVATAITLNRRA